MSWSNPHRDEVRRKFIDDVAIGTAEPTNPVLAFKPHTSACGPRPSRFAPMLRVLLALEITIVVVVKLAESASLIV